MGSHKNVGITFAVSQWKDDQIFLLESWAARGLLERVMYRSQKSGFSLMRPDQSVRLCPSQ